MKKVTFVTFVCGLILAAVGLASAAPAHRCNGIPVNHVVQVSISQAHGEHLVVANDPTFVCKNDTVEWQSVNDIIISFNDPMKNSVIFNLPGDYKITVTQTGHWTSFKYTVTSGNLVLDPHIIIEGNE
jgi:hypothetical protein